MAQLSFREGFGLKEVVPRKKLDSGSDCQWGRQPSRFKVGFFFFFSRNLIRTIRLSSNFRSYFLKKHSTTSSAHIRPWSGKRFVEKAACWDLPVRSQKCKANPKTIGNEVRNTVTYLPHPWKVTLLETFCRLKVDFLERGDLVYSGVTECDLFCIEVRCGFHFYSLLLRLFHHYFHRSLRLLYCHFFFVRKTQSHTWWCASKYLSTGAQKISKSFLRRRTIYTSPRAVRVSHRQPRAVPLYIVVLCRWYIAESRTGKTRSASFLSTRKTKAGTYRGSRENSTREKSMTRA